MKKTHVLSVLIFLPLILASAQTGPVSLPPCSTAIHDAFKTIGPDGQTYPTWHPVIHLAGSGCYFDHDHGSNPAFANPGQGWKNQGWPAFGYTAAVHGMPEGNAGFKVYVFDLQGVRFTITQHMGTANAVGAACNQFHTLDVQARDVVNGTLLADIHGMADYGQSRFNGDNTPLTPATCPDNPTRSGNGIRQLPIGQGVGYEPWRAAKGPNEFGFDAMHLTINTNNPQTGCNDITCTTNVQRTDVGGVARGTSRFVTMYAGFGFADGPRGSFVSSDGLQQYIAPGWTWTLAQSAECRPFGADYFYQCTYGPAIRQWSDEMQYRLNPFVTGGN